MLTTEQKYKLLKDIDFPKGFGFWKTVQVILWDLNINRTKINKFYDLLNAGYSVKSAYYNVKR